PKDIARPVRSLPTAVYPAAVSATRRNGIVDRARGRWFEILPRLGIDREYLRRTRGPCPICGGRDRFRWLDDIGFGNYACRQCGPGDGFILLRKARGWSAQEAHNNVDDLVGPEPVCSE